MPFLKCNVHEIPRSRQLENTSHKQGLRHAIVTPWRDTYVGEWKKSHKDGNGSMATRSSRLYEGLWMKDFRHNFGISARKNDDNVYIIEYRGNWKYGRYSGFGERHYKDDSYYKGNMKNSKRHGYGQMWYAKGSYYDGNWKNDLRDGMGMMVYDNGNRYEGQWLNNLKHGNGQYFHLDRGQMQKGVWFEHVCVTSYMVDIPFRQSAPHPSQYPIQKNELINYEEVYQMQEELALRELQELTTKKSNLSSTLIAKKEVRLDEWQTQMKSAELKESAIMIASTAIKESKIKMTANVELEEIEITSMDFIYQKYVGA